MSYCPCICHKELFDNCMICDCRKPGLPQPTRKRMSTKQFVRLAKRVGKSFDEERRSV